MSPVANAIATCQGRTSIGGIGKPLLEVRSRLSTALTPNPAPIPTMEHTTLSMVASASTRLPSHAPEAPTVRMTAYVLSRARMAAPSATAIRIAATPIVTADASTRTSVIVDRRGPKADVTAEVSWSTSPGGSFAAFVAFQSSAEPENVRSTLVTCAGRSKISWAVGRLTKMFS